jgi:hypothetical protein
MFPSYMYVPLSFYLSSWVSYYIHVGVGFLRKTVLHELAGKVNYLRCNICLNLSSYLTIQLPLQVRMDMEAEHPNYPYSYMLKRVI